jgi:LAGLIDADG DNA endonuclease family
MSKMFSSGSGFESSSDGLWVPPGYARRNGDLFSTLDQLTKAGKLSDGERQQLDKELSKKIGTLFRIYYNIWNSSVTWGAAEKPVSTPTTMILREASRQSLIDRLLIGTRCFQVRHVCQRVTTQSKQKGWNVRHRFHADPNFTPPPDVERRCREVEEIILHPNPEIHGRANGLRDALVKMVRGELVIDRKVMVTIRDSRGRPASWHMLPPDEIKPRLQVLLRHMKMFSLATVDAAVESVYEKFGVDVTNAAYIQEIDNRICGAWDADTCHVDLVNPSDEIDRYGWGISPLEESLEATTLLMLGLYYNKQNFLCSHGDGKLDTDRGRLPLHYVVNNRLPVKVRSYDEKTGQYVWGQVTNWFKYPAPEQWVEITHDACSRRNAPLVVTPIHRLYAGPDAQHMKKVAAKDLKVGDNLFMPSPSLTKEQRQLLLGTLLGDASLRKQKHGTAPNLRCAHGEKQRDYLAWKERNLANLKPKHSSRKHDNGSSSASFETPSSLVLRDLYYFCYRDGAKNFTQDWLNEVDEFGLAIWFMDDGCLGRSRVQKPRAVLTLHPCSEEERHRIIRWFFKRWGLTPEFGKSSDRSHRLCFDTRDTEKLCKILGPYIQFSEDYSKESKQWVGKDIPVGLEETAWPVAITQIAEIPRPPEPDRAKQGWEHFCYDIEVAPNHTYCLQNVTSSNSNYPEAFLFIQGDVDQEGLEVFKKQIYAQIGSQGNQRLPVFATGDPQFRTELHRLRDSLSDMQFVQLIRMAIALKCSAFRAHPSEINFSPDLGERGAIISSDTQEKQIALSQEEGYHSLLDNIALFITATLIEPIYDDLMMVWSIEDAPTETEMIDIWTKRLAMGNTIDEWRKADGRPPLEEVSGGKWPGNVPNSPFPLEYAQFDAQREQMEQQMEMERQRAAGDGFAGMEGEEPANLKGR